VEVELCEELRVVPCEELRVVPCEELRVEVVPVFRVLFEERVWATMPGAASIDNTSVRVVAIVDNLLIRQ
jgi:hypothetical protein